MDAVDGTQGSGKKSMRVVLYVKADGRHVPVEEDSLNAHGQRTAAEHIVYSSWGETVRPKAPQASISIGHGLTPPEAHKTLVPLASNGARLNLRTGGQSCATLHDPPGRAQVMRLTPGRTGADRAAGPELPGE